MCTQDPDHARTHLDRVPVNKASGERKLGGKPQGKSCCNPLTVYDHDGDNALGQQGRPGLGEGKKTVRTA